MNGFAITKNDRISAKRIVKKFINGRGCPETENTIAEDLARRRHEHVSEELAIAALDRLLGLAYQTGPTLSSYNDHNGFGQHDKLREDLKSF